MRCGSPARCFRILADGQLRKDKEVPTCDGEAGEPSTPLAKSPDTTWPQPPQSKRPRRSERWKNETSHRRGGGHRLRHAVHDVPPLQYVPHGREQLTAAHCGTGLVSVRIAAQPGQRGVEIFSVNISMPRWQRPPARKAQRAKIVILEILERLSQNDLCQA
jgi:hypothetical protein